MTTSTTTEKQEQPPTKKVKRRGYTPPITTICEQYVKGRMHIRAIAEHHDVSYGKVRDMLEDAGVTLRPRGASRPVAVAEDAETAETSE